MWPADLQNRERRVTVPSMDRISSPAPPDGPDASPSARKSALRRLALQKRAALGGQEREAASHVIAARLAEWLPDILKTRNIPSHPPILAGYWPIRDEVDPRPAMHALEQAGFALVLPAIVHDQLVFRRYCSADSLVKGPFNTLEPGPDQPALNPDIMLVPLVGFDSGGNRLGYGAGFYDRAQAGFGGRRPLTIGLAFECQLLPDLPVEPHDQPLDGVLTERDLRLGTV